MTEHWEPPEYIEVDIRPSYTDRICERCGAFVANFITHNQHHFNLDMLKDGLVALTRIIAPGAPSGSLLHPVAVRGGEGGEAGQVAPDGTIAGGGEGQPGYLLGQASIGRGGMGNDPCIPECPMCHAIGGGGHGGGCPNRGRLPYQWQGGVNDH